MQDSHASRFSMISPLDHRYYFANRELCDTLSRFLSEEAVIRYNVHVELMLLQNLAPYYKVPEEHINRALESATHITAEEVLEEESRTQHNIRAMVNVLKKHVPQEISHLVHLGATSFDISDTATSLRIKDVSRKVLIPLLLEVHDTLIQLTESYIDIPQVGRTHGQYAVPITLGHTFAEYVSRLGNSILYIEELSTKLTGKLSGAVGAYNALSLMVDDPLLLERSHIQALGLVPSEYSNQVSAPEPVLRLLLEYNVAFGIIANLADDLRNLQRSEIGELIEHFDKTSQTGSSTMPHKQNPWNSEHVKSLYKTFSPRILTFYHDQITEHQRDLTNSASQRFIAEYLTGFAIAANRTLSILQTLHIHEAHITKNLANAGDSLLAEAVYILLALAGHANAHETVRLLSIKMIETQCSIVEALQEHSEIWTLLETKLQDMGYHSPQEFFSSPTHYIGKAVQHSKIIVDLHKTHQFTIKEKLLL